MENSLTSSHQAWDTFMRYQMHKREILHKGAGNVPLFIHKRTTTKGAQTFALNCNAKTE